MRFPFRAERGSATAEVAVAMPAVVIILAACLSGLQLAGQQIRLQDAAAAASRAVARGDDPSALVLRLAPGAEVSVGAGSGVECVTLTQGSIAAMAALLSIRLSATGCAPAGGR